MTNTALQAVDYIQYSLAYYSHYINMQDIDCQWQTLRSSWYFMIRWIGLISISGICSRCPSFSRNSCKITKPQHLSRDPIWPADPMSSL